MAERDDPNDSDALFTRYPAVTVLGISVDTFVAKQSGLRGAVMHTGEPLCGLWGVIPTEAATQGWAHADAGLPHTLEHLIFLGYARVEGVI